MANNGMTPSENARAIASMIREEDLEDLNRLHREVIDRVDKARDDGRLYLMAQYTRIVAMLSAEIDRVNRRFNRETLAAMRREHKGLKQAARNGSSS